MKKPFILQVAQWYDLRTRCEFVNKARNRSILPDLNLKKVDLIFAGQVQVFLEWPETWPEKNQVNLNLPDWPELTWIDLNEN